MGPSHVLRQIGQAETGEGGIEGREDAVEDKLPLDAHVDLVAVLFEFPGVKTTLREEAQIDAKMID